MLNWLLAADKSVFLFINTSLANPVTDFIMPIVTNDNLLRVGYALAMVIMLAVWRKKAVWIVVVSLIVVALTDQASSAWLKHAVERMRPCKVMSVHLLVHCGSGYSFPSSHAANLFGQGVFFAFLLPAQRWYLYGFAFLVAVSRIFVGVHYPLDVLGGSILGAIVGLAAGFLLKNLNDRKMIKPEIVIMHRESNEGQDLSG